ncbi:phosphoenolpyruvate-utilizing N-terminal domain-containing protein [Superficieibacter sp. 1612_C1]|uniref:phosphoenolpyruvate-utilizing N-terminal domain-containing protein n=1 Tax=Superficieibacter sp. 1612_C1 TaxID=2780382 RepID=UPI00188335CA|nr:phosphoenolpyruvate-utilizing N-terminal domain-containing protein [Superficieibacter sp. 1612_C1]
MQILTGNAVSPGIVLAPIWFWRPVQVDVTPHPVADPAQELTRLENACHAALSQLQMLEDKVRAEKGDAIAQLFSAHQFMLEDDDFQQEIRDAIVQQRVNAVWAVRRAGDQFAAQMAAMEDAYFQARAADVRDVAGRLIALLCNHCTTPPPLPAGKAILFAEEILPSDTVQLDKQYIAAIVTRQGSALSHSAILARAMGIPAIMGLDVADLPAAWEGLDAIIDGEAGHIYLTPDSETQQRYHMNAL